MKASRNWEKGLGGTAAKKTWAARKTHEKESRKSGWAEAELRFRYQANPRLPSASARVLILQSQKLERNKELRKKGSPCIFMYKHCNFLSAFGWNEKKHMGTYTLRDATSHATYYLIGNLPKRKLFCWIRLCIVIRRNRKFSFRTRPWW